MHLSSKLMLLCVYAIACAFGMLAAAPYQELAPRAGHVPVYIRVGNTPLTEIHPGLAEAFREFESASLLLESPDAKEPQQESQAVATTTPAPTATTTTTTSTTESDIASFDAVRGVEAGESNDATAAESSAAAPAPAPASAEKTKEKAESA